MYFLNHLNCLHCLVLIQYFNQTEESCDKYVKLNVGGSLHMTTLSTLKKQDSMLRAMFSGRMVIMTDKEGF